jgi:starch synthase
MNVAILTREYPPAVYGGAGVHVEYLSRELARSVGVEVRRFAEGEGETPDGVVVHGYSAWPELEDSVLRTMSIDLAMADRLDVDLVHSHTWYAIFAGHLAKLRYGIPHVVTTHSLEPLRPWKAEQLGAGGYALSSFCERTGIENADAIVAVSGAMRDDVLSAYPQVDPGRVEVIHNGIDTEQYKPDERTDVLERHGIDPNRPYVLFVGRISRQKGIVHLLDAAPQIDPSAQLVFCAGAADTKELEAEVRAAVAEVERSRGGVVWVEQMLPRPDVIQLLTHATVFCTPSVYEPLGIVNLEAMACETAVVSTWVGGIPEVVADGETGLLVHADPRPSVFADGLAQAVNTLLADPARAEAMGKAGRERVLRHFTWKAIAGRTLELYDRLAGVPAVAASSA